MKHTDDNYHTVTDALEILNLSRATLYSKISNNTLKSEKIGKYRFIYIDEEVRQEHMSAKHSIEQTRQTDQRVDEQTIDLLREQLEYFKKQNESLQTQLAEKELNQSEASKRHDTIVMELTTTINNQQLQLQESKSVSLWQRLFNWS